MYGHFWMQMQMTRKVRNRTPGRHSNDKRMYQARPCKQKFFFFSSWALSARVKWLEYQIHDPKIYNILRSYLFRVVCVYIISHYHLKDTFKIIEMAPNRQMSPLTLSHYSLYWKHLPSKIILVCHRCLLGNSLNYSQCSISREIIPR